MRAFPGVVFGESPLKVVGMAPVEFTGRFKRFENVSVIPGILKDGLPSVARNCAAVNTGKSSFAKATEDTILRSKPLAQFRAKDGGGGGN